jgi:hypothetical protein
MFWWFDRRAALIKGHLPTFDVAVKPVLKDYLKALACENMAEAGPVATTDAAWHPGTIHKPHRTNLSQARLANHDPGRAEMSYTHGFNGVTC